LLWQDGNGDPDHNWIASLDPDRNWIACFCFIHDTGFDHNQSTHKRICHNTKSASVGIPEEMDIHSSFEQMPKILAR
jgi:hypothetical protein